MGGSCSSSGAMALPADVVASPRSGVTGFVEYATANKLAVAHKSLRPLATSIMRASGETMGNLTESDCVEVVQRTIDTLISAEKRKSFKHRRSSHLMPVLSITPYLTKPSLLESPGSGDLESGLGRTLELASLYEAVTKECSVLARFLDLARGAASDDVDRLCSSFDESGYLNAQSWSAPVVCERLLSAGSFQGVLSDSDLRDLFSRARNHKACLLTVLKDEAGLAANFALEGARWEAARAERMLGESIEKLSGEVDDGLSAGFIAVARGDIVQAPKLQRPAEIALFVSSTFVDTQVERNYMQAYLFPDVAALCRSHGLLFNVIDLRRVLMSSSPSLPLIRAVNRWGVSRDSSDDHSTEELCLGEIARCRDRSAMLPFLFFSGERYGWRGLPREIPAAEMNILLREIPAPSLERSTVEFWYEEDTNRIPPRFLLQRVSAAGSALAGERFIPPGVPLNFWPGIGETDAQSILVRALRGAAVAAGFVGEQLEKYILSVTHKEVKAGLSNAGIGAGISDIICVMRTIRNLGTLAEKQDVLGFYTTEIEDRQLLAMLRKETVAKVAREFYLRYEVPWDDEHGINIANVEHERYVRRLCADVYAIMASRIVTASPRPISLQEREVLHHAAFAAKRASQFVGRTELLARLATLLASNTPTIKVVWGGSGCGKTSVMCKAGADLGTSCIKIFRLAGTSPGSSNCRALLESICLQLVAAVGPAAQSLLPDVRKLADLVASFPLLLARAAPVIVMIDSLDQLSDEYHGRSEPWSWLPTTLPPGVRIVVSTLPDDAVHKRTVLSTLLHSSWPAAPTSEADRIEIPYVPEGESVAIVRDWLASKNQTLTTTQWSVVTKSLAGQDPSILHLRLVVDCTAGWTSGLYVRDLPKNVPDLIDGMFEELEAKHGLVLLGRVLGLLICSRGGVGLSEGNIVDMLCASDDVLGWVDVPGAVFEFHEPPARRLPPAVFRRLVDGMRDFVVERGGPGGVSVLGFYHRQFWEAAQRRYNLVGASANTRRTFFHKLLAYYFGGELAALFPVRSLDPHQRQVSLLSRHPPRAVPSLQALSELPYALREAGRVADCVALTCSLDFVAAKAHAGMLDELVEDWAAMYGAVRAAGDDKSLRRFEEYRRFLMRNTLLFSLEPASVIQTAGLERSYLAQSADAANYQRELETRASRAPMVSWLNEPPALVENPLRVLFFGHSEPLWCCVYSPSGDRVLTCSDDHTARLFDATTGLMLHTYEGHSEPVYDCKFRRDGLAIITSSTDLFAKLWDIGGDIMVSLGPHPSSVNACSYSSDIMGLRAVTCCDDKLVRIWLSATGVLLFTLTGHVEPVYFTCFSPTSENFVTVSDDGSARLWSSETGLLVNVYTGHSAGLNCCSVSGDGKLLATASTDSTAKLFDVASASLLVTFKGHTGPVWSCSLSSDGKMLVTASIDESAIIWNTTTGAILTQFQGHSGSVKCCCFGPDGTSVLTCGEDRTARIWSVDKETDGRITLNGHASAIIVFAYNASGSACVLANADGTARIRDLSSGVHLCTLRGHSKFVLSIAVSLDKALAVTGSDDKSACIWDISTGHLQHLLSGHEGFVRSCAISSDNAFALTGSDDCTAKLWSCRDGALVTTFDRHKEWVRGCSFNRSNSLAVTASDDKTVCVWQVSSFELLFVLLGHDDLIRHCIFSHNDEFLATCSDDKTTRTWHMTQEFSDNRVAHIFSDHRDLVRCSNFSKDDALLCTGSDDKTVKIWKALSGELLTTLGPHSAVVRAVQFDAGGVLWTAALDGSTYQWERRALSYVLVHQQPQSKGGVTCCDLSHDAKFVATCGRDQQVNLWDCYTGKLLRTFGASEHTDWIITCAFVEDPSSLFMTCCLDGVTRVFDYLSGSFIRSLDDFAASYDRWSSAYSVSPLYGALHVYGKAKSAGNRYVNGHSLALFASPGGRPIQGGVVYDDFAAPPCRVVGWDSAGAVFFFHVKFI